MMWKWTWLLAGLLVGLVAGGANAQSYQRIGQCGNGAPGLGSATGYMDANGNICMNGNGAKAYAGNGALGLTTSSAQINTMTVDALGAVLPASLTYLVVIDNGSADLAICPKGGSCTCPANGVAATNGLTVKANGGSYVIYSPSGIASSVPSVVACSGTPVAEFQW